MMAVDAGLQERRVAPGSPTPVSSPPGYAAAQREPHHESASPASDQARASRLIARGDGIFDWALGRPVSSPTRLAGEHPPACLQVAVGIINASNTLADLLLRSSDQVRDCGPGGLTRRAAPSAGAMRA